MQSHNFHVSQINKFLHIFEPKIFFLDVYMILSKKIWSDVPTKLKNILSSIHQYFQILAIIYEKVVY